MALLNHFQGLIIFKFNLIAINSSNALKDKISNHSQARYILDGKRSEFTHVY